MHRCIGEPQALRAQTEPRDRWVPELGHGDAIEESTQNSPGPVCSQHGNHEPADASHPSGWKDTEVLHQNRGLGAKQGGVVEGDGKPEGLGFMMPKG